MVVMSRPVLIWSSLTVIYDHDMLVYWIYMYNAERILLNTGVSNFEMSSRCKFDPLMVGNMICRTTWICMLMRLLCKERQKGDGS